MKAYSFYFNASDWLASAAVKQMSLAERGAYIGLLAFAWGEKEPGTLPASSDKVRRLAEMTPAEWEVSSEAILEKFPLSECGTYRYNPRLIAEAKKQQELSEKNAENGRKSAERRAAEKAAKEAAAALAQRKANENSTTVAPNPTTVENSSTKIQPKLSQAKQSTNVDVEVAPPAPAPSPLKAEAGGQKLVGSANPARETALAVGDGDGELRWDESPLTKPHGFQAICEGNGYPGIDYEHYRKQALDAARNESPARPRTSPQWRSWVRKYLNYESKGGPLLQPAANMPMVPTPKHELPQPGKERQGQVIAIQGVPGDQNMNRMLVATYQSQFPTAVIHAILPRTS